MIAFYDLLDDVVIYDLCLPICFNRIRYFKTQRWAILSDGKYNKIILYPYFLHIFMLMSIFPIAFFLLLGGLFLIILSDSWEKSGSFSYRSRYSLKIYEYKKEEDVKLFNLQVKFTRFIGIIMLIFSIIIICYGLLID